MSYIKNSKHIGDEKIIVNARISKATVEAVKTASDLFKVIDEGQEISMSGIINQAMEEATNQCSEVLLVDLKKLSEHKIKMKACMDVIVDNITPSQKKKLRILRPDYEFTSPEQKNRYIETREYHGSRIANKELQEDEGLDKALTSKDFVDDPRFWVDIDDHSLSIAIQTSNATKSLFSSLEASRKDKKFDELKSLHKGFPRLHKVFDELKITNYKLFDEKFTEVKNKYVIAETKFLTDAYETDFFYRWDWSLSVDLGGYPKKIHSVLIKMGLLNFIDPLDIKNIL